MNAFGFAAQPNYFGQPYQHSCLKMVCMKDVLLEIETGEIRVNVLSATLLLLVRAGSNAVDVLALGAIDTF